MGPSGGPVPSSDWAQIPKSGPFSQAMAQIGPTGPKCFSDSDLLSNSNCKRSQWLHLTTCRLNLKTWQQNDPSVTQLDWDGLYNANYNNIYTLNNANGSGESYTADRSKYIMEEYRLDPRHYGLNSFGKYIINEFSTLNIKRKKSSISWY